MKIARLPDTVEENVLDKTESRQKEATRGSEEKLMMGSNRTFTDCVGNNRILRKDMK